jgi:RNA polymerase sigma factor (sigma-70 family)
MTDKELLKLCLKDDAQAQRQLYANYANVMMGVCYRYTKSVEDAEDVLQEAFIKVFKNLKQFSGEGELGGWIRRIMVNTALTYIKKHRRYTIEMDYDKMPMQPVSNDEADLHLNQKELADMIRKLPTGYQTVFNLHAVEGFSHIEIGQMLGINENTSRSQYSRARSTLIGWLNTQSSSENLQKAYV